MNDEGEDEEEDEEENEGDEGTVYSGIPIVLPRARFTGAANIRTIKDGELSFFYLMRHD
jgi:hypothetical protein